MLGFTKDLTGMLQVQEAAAQLTRSQHQYEELQRKQEALLCEMETCIARRSAIQIKVHFLCT